MIPMQRLALALLVAAGALFVFAHMHLSWSPAMGYLRAFAEAALVGGLADWFAVTALFRHPLGVPIPHTAIVPRNKERIGIALGDFVENNFLTREIVGGKLAEVDLAGGFARFLGAPEHAAPLAARITSLLPAMLDAVDATPVHMLLRDQLAKGLGRIEAGPLAARVLEVLLADGRREALFDDLLAQLSALLDEAEPALRARVHDRSAWLFRQLGLSERISNSILEAAEDALGEVADDPHHPWRRRFFAIVDDYIDDLQHAPEYRRRADEWKMALLDHPVFTQLIGDLWAAVGAHAREDAVRPDSRIRQHLESTLMHFGERLLADREARVVLNNFLTATFTQIAYDGRHAASALIAETVRMWDPQTIADKLERAVGRDLQYIRINGTLIGGLVGVCLHGGAQLLS